MNTVHPLNEEVRTRLIYKAAELLTRPKTHPSRAIMEAMQFLGYKIDIEEEMKRMQADMERQFAEAFPELAKKLDSK